MAAAVTDSWFRSEGRFRARPGGTLEYLGREVDVIVTSGRSVSALEIVRVVRQVKGVLDVAVLAYTPDERADRRIRAVVETTTPGPELDARIRVAVVGEIPGNACPRRVDRLRGLPRTETDKTGRRSLPDVEWTTEGERA